MTIPATTRKAGPLLGNGSTTAFPFTFKVFAASDIKVTIANNLGTETVLVLNTDYTVTLNPNQETSPGGTVTYPISGSALPSGSTLTIIGNLPYDQPLDLPSGGNFSPLALENQLDRLTMQIQQLREQVGRALTVPVNSTAAPALPMPEASSLIAWNENANGLENYPIADLATALAFATFRYDTFTGDGATTQYTLSADPVTLGNLDVAVGGVTQIPGVDYTLSSGVLEFTSAPPNGVSILARFGEGIVSGPSMDSYDVRFQPAGTGAVQRTVEGKLRETVSTADFGAVADFSTDNTAAVQAAIDSLGVYGGSVFNPYGCKFNLKNLTLPALVNMTYRANDEMSTPGSVSDIGSNELIEFSSNSSYPASPTGAIVNEWRFTAPFHPGFITDVRKDLTSAAAWARPGQSLTNPVRNSWNIADEQVGRFRVFYENYDLSTASNFSGVYFQGFKTIVRLNGIGTAAWSSVPAAGVRVTGTTSGAKGFVVSVDTGYTDVEWFSGRFQAGETVSDNNETTTATITTAVTTVTDLAWIAQDLLTGAWTCGNRPVGVGTEQLNISGNIKVVPTRSSSTAIPKTVTNPTCIWGDDPEAVSPNQLGLQYDTTVTAARRRLHQVRNDLTTWNGTICPVSAMVAFTDAALVDTNAVNVASITNTATGKYTVAFTNNLARTAYIPSISMDAFYMQNWWVGVTLRAVGSCEVWVKDNTGAFADIPAGAFVALTILGGDI